MREEGEVGAAGAPGGRPGRIGAPRGGGVLLARHGGTARPAIARGRGEGGECARGLGRLRPAGQKRGGSLLAPPCPLLFFLKFFFQIISQSVFDLFKSFFRLGP